MLWEPGAAHTDVVGGAFAKRQRAVLGAGLSHQAAVSHFSPQKSERHSHPCAACPRQLPMAPTPPCLGASDRVKITLFGFFFFLKKKRKKGMVLQLYFWKQVRLRIVGEGVGCL